ncbi:MAG: hypothetical protein HYS80_01115 [Candidatus Aenigmarchaeota archaeon]|nr:hypothetical protein [Candidatus Aenigmarchaeota archaeon]
MVYRKAQLSADFYVALLVFLGFLAYITFQLFQIAPASSSDVREESIRIEAYQISELLVNDIGHPLDWEAKSLAEIQRIGLSDSAKNITNYLLRAKVDQLKNICETPTGYQDVKNILDIQDEMSITFIEHALPSDIIWACTSPTPTNKENAFNISRTVSIGDTAFAEVIVEVWET